SLAGKMTKQGRSRFFIALLIDGVWVDLTTYGPGDNQGREVSEDRTVRYTRARKRALDTTGTSEVSNNTPMDVVEREAASAEVPQANQPDSLIESNYQTAQQERSQVVLAVNPAQVKALCQFQAMEEEQREAAIGALSALAMSADAFKSAVGVM